MIQDFKSYLSSQKVISQKKSIFMSGGLTNSIYTIKQRLKLV